MALPPQFMKKGEAPITKGAIARRKKKKKKKHGKPNPFFENKGGKPSPVALAIARRRKGGK